MAEYKVRVGDRLEPWTGKILWVLRDGEWHDFSTVVAKAGLAVPAPRAIRETEYRRTQGTSQAKERVRIISHSQQVASGRRALVYAAMVGMTGIERRKLGEHHRDKIELRDTRFDWPIRLAGELRSAHCGFGPANHNPCTYRWCGCHCHEQATLTSRGIGAWEAGSADDERCACCNRMLSLSGVQPQFLGLSNGDWAWCCTLTCLIDEAMKERDLYTDGVGPPAKGWGE